MFSSSPSLTEVLQFIQQHPQADALCTRVSHLALAAATEQRPQYLTGQQVPELHAAAPELTREQAETPWGNLLTLLDKGATTAVQWALLSAAVATYLGATWPQLAPGPSVTQLAWLAEHSGLNAWLFVDDCLEQHRAAFWAEATQQFPTWSGRAQLAVVSGVLGASSLEAREFKRAVLASTNYPSVLNVLELSAPLQPLQADLHAPPRRPVNLVLQALCGWLFVSAVGRTLGRYVLGGRRSVALEIDARGLRVVEQRYLLGRQLAERQRWLPLSDIDSITRETRFAGLGVYLGIAALALGSYLGVGYVVQGLRVPGGSPSTLGVGLLVVLVGVLAELLLSGLARHREGLTRVLLLPRKGRGWALGPLPVAQADSWLKQLAALRALKQ